MPESSEITIGKQTNTVTGSDTDTSIAVVSTVDTPLNTQPTAKVKAQADLLESYVAALGVQFAPWMGMGYIRQLPVPTDDLMRDFGTRLYDEDMMRDPQVYSTLSILVTAILAEGVKLYQPVEADDPKYDQATKIVQFCQWNIDNMRHPFMSILYELTEGMLKMGHKVGEMEYDMQDDVTPGAGPQIILSDILCKSHHATAFVVDGFDHVLGLLYVKPGLALPQLGSVLNILPAGFPAADLPDYMIPRQKFVIPIHKPRNNDPRGTSHLKSVYTAWWKKQQLIPQHMAYVARFAQPSIWANISKDAKDIPVKDPDGNITSYKSIVSAVTEALAKIKSGAVAAVIDTDIAMLEAKSDGKVIFDSIQNENHEIVKGILFQTLTTEEGQYMARAASAVHQDVFGIEIAYYRRNMEWCITNEILKPLILYNFGVDVANTLIPTVSLGDTERQDKPAMMNALAALANANGVHESQWPGLWRMLDFPPVNEKEWAVDQEIRNEQQQNALELAKNPPPPMSTPAGGSSPPPAGGASGQGGPGAGSNAPQRPAVRPQAGRQPPPQQGK